MVGLIAPLYRIFPAPLEAVPTLKCVSVSDPPVAAGKSTFAAGLTLLAVTVKPAPDRATATLAYDVYAASLVVCEPASPGSAVCSAKYKLPTVVLPRSPVASP